MIVRLLFHEWRIHARFCGNCHFIIVVGLPSVKHVALLCSGDKLATIQISLMDH